MGVRSHSVSQEGRQGQRDVTGRAGQPLAVFLRNNDRQSKPIIDGLIEVLQPLPHAARRSITFDRATEFSEWPYLQAGIGTQTWLSNRFR